MSSELGHALEQHYIECIGHDPNECTIDAALAIEQEAVTRVLDALAGDIHRRMNETQAWIDTHPTRAAALNAVNGAAIAAFHEALGAIEQHRPKGGPG